MVASGAITSTLDVITSLSCIVVLLASPVDGAPLGYARARLPAPRPSREHSPARLCHPTRASRVKRGHTPGGCVERRARCSRVSPCLGTSRRKFHTTWACRAGPTAGDGACDTIQRRQLSQIERGVLM